MFPPARQPVAEERLRALAESMRYTREREGTLTPRVGYTYFGQFVGHDISHDGTALDGPFGAPEATPNFRTPFADLDHLYGGGPEQAPHLYTGARGAELFKIGRTDPSGYLRDMPIENGDFVLVDADDRRNLDNLILRQLQVVFLKFHNEAVRQLSEDGGELRKSVQLEQASIFETARRLVCWHYQWIVRHDFLPRVVHPAFWETRRQEDRRAATGAFALPIEFTLAAFRYGHTIVREAYPLNCRRRRVTLLELLREGQQPSPLGDDAVIEWGRYFDGLPRSGPAASSAFIDTAIAEPLHGMPPETLRLCSAIGSRAGSARLAERTLLRAARSGVASGQEVAAALVAQHAIAPSDPLSSEELTADTCNESGSALRSAQLVENTPLFYYLLKEAELRSGGLTLGPVGSYIVGKVLLDLLESDSGGYFANAGADWTLPSWRFPSGLRQPVNSIVSIIRLVGDDALLPECARHAAEFVPHEMREGLLRRTIATA